MKQITGKHVLFILFGFFGVMLAVNGVFVHFATATFSGVSTEDAYRKGLHYNETIAAFQVQQATGWHPPFPWMDRLCAWKCRTPAAGQSTGS